MGKKPHMTYDEIDGNLTYKIFVVYFDTFSVIMYDSSRTSPCMFDPLGLPMLVVTCASSAANRHKLVEILISAR